MRYYGDSWNWMMGSGLGMMAGWGIVGWITLFLFWTLMILGIIALVSHLTKQDKRDCCSSSKGSYHNTDSA